MSCGSIAAKIANWGSRISAGISQLSGKRAYYAGLALGGAGLAGAGVVALSRRWKAAGRPAKSTRIINYRQIPQLPARTKIKPTPPLKGERCTGCRTPSQTKPGLWYRVNNRPYCQDCAPDAARKADVDLVLPAAKPARREKTAPNSITPASGRRPFGSSAEPYPPERKVDSQLLQSRIRVRRPDGRSHIVENSLAVLRRNGLDTGLAISPAIQPNGRGGLREDTSRWFVTHVQTGLELAGPYAHPAEAQMLASVMAQADWTQPAENMTMQMVRRARATITAYDQALAEAKGVASGQPDKPKQSGQPKQSSQPKQPGKLTLNDLLDGRLVADGYGGVSRVLEDNGERLFLVDPEGKRFEVGRNEIRLPDEFDFEAARIAMSFDPTAEAEVKCAAGGCGQSSRRGLAGEMWYKMEDKAFCESCAKKHALDEGYIMEEEIGEL